MFKTTLAETALLRDPIASIAELIDEGIFRLTKSGLSFTAADRAMVSVVDYHLTSTAFEKYEIDQDQKIGLNITNFLSVIKRAGAKDKISFELSDAKLQITIEGNSKRKFTVPILDIGEEEIPPIAQLEFKTKIHLKSEVLQNGVSDAEIVGDSVIISSGPDSFRMTAEDDVRKAELELQRGNESLIELSSPSEEKSRYALDYLKKMSKAVKMADTVTIEHGTDYPMKISFNATDKARLSFILAPRVTED